MTKGSPPQKPYFGDAQTQGVLAPSLRAAAEVNSSEPYSFPATTGTALHFSHQLAPGDCINFICHLISEGVCSGIQGVCNFQDGRDS